MTCQSKVILGTFEGFSFRQRNRQLNIYCMYSCFLRPVEQLSSEVVVGAQCGSAVLRGAHVFAPGIIASPKCKTLSFDSLGISSFPPMAALHVVLMSSDMKAGDLVSVFSDLEGRCTRGATSFQGNKVFVGNGVAEMDRSAIFNAETPARLVKFFLF